MARGEVNEARRRDSRSLWNAKVHRQMMMLYFVGMLDMEVGVVGVRDKRTRLWITSTSLDNVLV